MKKIIKLRNLKIGEKFLIIAGPCAIESEKQLFETAKRIKKYIDILRGGAFKPRTSPYSFQGLGKKGLEILKKVGKKLNLPTITEVMNPCDVSLVSSYCDILQVGARNMQNFSLLKEIGKTKMPILLKRGFGSTVKEWLFASEYIKKEGNHNIILCERGIRTFESSFRFTLDLAGALLAKKISGYPTFIDLSHSLGTADSSLIIPLAKAVKSAGFDGLMLEVHFRPQQAKSDKDQSLSCQQFIKIVKAIKN